MTVRSEKRRLKWEQAGLIKTSRGCESNNCPLPQDFNFEPVDLDFDHLYIHDKKGNVSDLIRSDYGWSTILAEIQKCRVLCKLCHARHNSKTRTSHNEHRELYATAPLF